MTRPVIFWLAVLFLFSGGTTVALGWRLISQRATVAEESSRAAMPPPRGADDDWLTRFTLIERTGEPFESESLEGQVHVVSFFFVNCPSFCSMQNSKVQMWHEEFKDRGVRFLSITCDPDQDTPDRLRQYARSYDAGPESWLFLTGELPYLRRVAGEMYQVALSKQTHSERLMVVDKWGNIRGQVHWNAGTEEDQRMRELLERLLAEQAPPDEFEVLGQTPALVPVFDDDDDYDDLHQGDLHHGDDPPAADADASSSAPSDPTP